MKTTDRPTVVIGLGNPLMGDDGLGLAALELLRSSWTFEPGVELVDGGTWGMSLLPTIESAGKVLFIDAIDNHAVAGAFVELGRHELPRLFTLKVSPHQIDLREVLAVAELRGTLPDVTVAMGLQPGRIEMSTELSASLADRLDPLVRRIVWRLEAWGHEPVVRERAPARMLEQPCTK